MYRWINFYKNLDNRLNNALTKIMIIGILPLIVATALTSFNFIGYSHYNTLSLSHIWEFIAVIVLNYTIIISVGIFIVLGLIFVMSVMNSLFMWFHEVIKFTNKFKRHVKEASLEELDRNNIDLQPKKHNLNIKE